MVRLDTRRSGKRVLTKRDEDTYEERAGTSERSSPACCVASRFPLGNNLKERSEASKHAGKNSRDGMVHLRGGEFLMGADDSKGFSQDGEGPVRQVRLDSFWIDRCAVSNARFSEFVEKTGYETDAERFGWSFVFFQFLSPRAQVRVKGVVQGATWWRAVQGACWKHPEGSGSSVKERMDHPVVHVSWHDALTYCEWTGRRLLTESEWEYAARGGFKQRRYPWGNTLTPNREHRCNIWQGEFPHKNTAQDGYLGTAPVDAFEPNGYELYNVSGNVWEWCSDWFSATFHRRSGEKIRENPKGPLEGKAKVIRGGSYLCHKSYCNRYRVAARTSNTPASSTGNMGFRCAADG